MVAEPTLIADAHETPHLRMWPPLMAWMRDHGLDPHLVRRMERHVIDCPLIRVTEYVRGDDGQIEPTLGPHGIEAMTRTRDVLLRSEPPTYGTTDA